MRKPALIYLSGSFILVLLFFFAASFFFVNTHISPISQVGIGGGPPQNNVIIPQTGALSDKTGDNFDRAFISAMIENSQGAINMAKEAQKLSKHSQLKDLAAQIIKSESDRIDALTKMQNEWGY